MNRLLLHLTGLLALGAVAFTEDSTGQGGPGPGGGGSGPHSIALGENFTNGWTCHNITQNPPTVTFASIQGTTGARPATLNPDGNVWDVEPFRSFGGDEYQVSRGKLYKKGPGGWKNVKEVGGNDLMPDPDSRGLTRTFAPSQQGDVGSLPPARRPDHRPGVSQHYWMQVGV